MKRVIIGVTGMYCSGKDTVAEYLEKKGFKHYSLSDMIREEARRRGMEPTRELLIKLGKEMREFRGHGILGELAAGKMKGTMTDFVITSIRHPAEVEALKNTGSFILLEVRTPIRERFRRIKKRKREQDPKTLKDLQASEELESAKDGPGQQLTNVLKLADYVILNDGTLKKLRQKTDALMKDLKIKAKTLPHPMRPSKEQLKKLFEERPTKVRYYMDIAAKVASRSNCLSTKHGSIMVKEDQIIATGYNGAPRKVRDCMERGTCLRRELRIPSGQRYELCRSIHSEANAIINAARAGVSVLGADLYLFSQKVWKDERKLVDAYPCFICKKFLINAGINDVYCQQADGKIKKYRVSDWIKAWEEGDMIDDMDVYDSEYKGMKDRKCC